jgi:hypothetical protein
MIAPNTVTPAETEQFLSLLWPEDGDDDAYSGQLNVWTLEGRRSVWFPCRRRSEAAAAAVRLAGKANVYCGTALIDLEKRNQIEAVENRGVVDVKAIRGTNATASAIPGLWADVDVGGPIHGKAHKNTKLPPTYEHARALIAEAIPLEPTVIIDSGHGLYFWWLFAEPWSLDTEQDREEAAELVYRFQATLRKRAEAHGWEIDGTADLARVLRLPGTINHKLDPVPVKIVALDETRRYQTDSFDPYLVDVEYRNVISEPVPLPDDLEPVELDSLPLAPWIKKLILDGNEWVEEKQAWRYGSRSQAVWRVVNEMVEAELSDATMAAVLLDDRYKISENPMEKGRRARPFVAREIGKARKYQENKPPESRINLDDIGDGDQRTDVDPGPAAEPKTLDDVTATFKKWLYLSDVGPVLVVLAAIAANRMQGDPVWLMIVGASSGGKTEILNASSHLDHVHLAAVLTEAALLSGTPKKDKAKGSKGGLLREIGAFGILLLKDFTSILSMNRDPRAALLAALREVYDGSWTRHIGTDGGRTLHWEGKLGLVACCTTIIDAHHAVTSTMGERFLYYRLPEIPPKDQAKQALRNAGREREMRDELAASVAGLFAGVDLPERQPDLSDAETDQLVALASLAARARSGVERDGRTREIELIPDAEAPARLVQALRRLYGGLLVVGVDRDEAWPLVVKVGLDCMPKLRRSIFEYLVDHEEWSSTTEIATTVEYPTQTARRSLEDLMVHGLVLRKAGGKGKSDNWMLSKRARQWYAEALGTFPEMSVDEGERAEGTGNFDLLESEQHIVSDFSGTPSDVDEEGRHCWSCKATLLEELDEQCSDCGWMICTGCGACKCEAVS